MSTAVLPYQLVPGANVAGFTVSFMADRRLQHYIAKVIVPLLLIIMMSWAAFWLHTSLSASQISIAVTSMLTLIAYRSAVGSETPKLPYLTNMDVFILASSILVLLTLIEVIVTTTRASAKRGDLAERITFHSRYLFPLATALVTLVTLMR